MGIRFQIRSTASSSNKEGDQIVRFTGESEPYVRTTNRRSSATINSKGEKIFVFVTGLEKDRMDYYSWFSPEEKEIIKKQLDDHLPELEKLYGKENLDSKNKYRWQEDKAFYNFRTTITKKNEAYDTDYPEHAILYFSVIGGAFIDLVAPTYNYAKKHRIPHYIALESDIDENTDYASVTDQLTAAENLSKMFREDPTDAMFIIAWNILPTTKGFATLLKSTPKSVLVTELKEYIEGKKVDREKRKCASNFINAFEKWSNTQTRAEMYAQAYIRAGEEFGIVINNKKRFELSWGTELGNTIEESVKTITAKRNAEDLKRLTEEVDKKWLK